MKDTEFVKRNLVASMLLCGYSIAITSIEPDGFASTLLAMVHIHVVCKGSQC